MLTFGNYLLVNFYVVKKHCTTRHAHTVFPRKSNLETNVLLMIPLYHLSFKMLPHASFYYFQSLNFYLLAIHLNYCDVSSKTASHIKS